MPLMLRGYRSLEDLFETGWGHGLATEDATLKQSSDIWLISDG